jgi:hypothetical protein
MLFALTASAADPVYLDQLIETPLATLQQQFPTLKTEGCWALEDGHFLQITIHRKERKPWRVTLSSEQPCKRAEGALGVDVRARSGVVLGDITSTFVQRMGRPDASAPPNPDQRKLGDIEYFYICRVTEGCARHTSVFVRAGVVSAISEWYSE